MEAVTKLNTKVFFFCQKTEEFGVCYYIDHLAPSYAEPPYHDDTVTIIMKEIRMLHCDDVSIEELTEAVNRIQNEGFQIPIVVDENDNVIAGRANYHAAKQMKLGDIPCILASELTHDQIEDFQAVDISLSTHHTLYYTS